MSKLLHTMIRISDPVQSLKFYIDIVGMVLVEKLEFPDQRFSLYFIQFEGADAGSQIELTHNWDAVDPYDGGTGYGHMAIGVDDLVGTVEHLRAAGVPILREPGPVIGGTAKIAFVSDPDGYKIELIENE
ncbi:lactoylglutathione lyase [Aquamicrobium segne]|uniref:Aldoketomutase n=1 Tax=Aquamicrobium segne TaxID=469547 RepID=A0ABW0GWX3_9HYPH